MMPPSSIAQVQIPNNEHVAVRPGSEQIPSSMTSASSVPLSIPCRNYVVSGPHWSSNRPAKKKGIFKLRRYIWRSLLTFFGPLALLGFYSFICTEFLASTPANNIVTNVRVDARWIYYLWFIVAVLTLEWARAGLANVEAAALMDSHLAPRTAMGLMWHTDTRWSNLLWWLRALRFWLRRSISRKVTTTATRVHGPNLLWLLLSLTTILLYIAMPLSGLTMELSAVLVSSSEPVQIFGPNMTSFNARGASDIVARIYNYWQSGRPSTPLSSAILYAPEGIPNVSTTYFDNEVVRGASAVHFFAGPAVRETVVGRAWGMDANISCQAVQSAQLQLLRIHDVGNYSIHGCMRHDENKSCSLEWSNTQELGKHGYPGFVEFPSWLNMSGLAPFGYYNFSAIMAADGWDQDYFDNANPYTYEANHDNLTFDHVFNKRAAEEPTTSMLEIFLWQATQSEDMIPVNLTDDFQGLVEVRQHHFDDLMADWWDVPFYGIGVHCDVTTAVGYAEVIPAHRTYSGFKRTHAPLASLDGLPNLIATDPLDPNAIAPTHPAQILALKAVGSRPDESLHEDTWNTLHYAIGSATLPPSKDGPGLLALTPANLQFAMYRLLGDSVIAMMDEEAARSWHGELYRLVPSRYLTSGVVPWIYVFAILSVWPLLTSIGALWLLFPAGPRWASSLDGFEMFKFGAQYTDQIDDLGEVDFQGCNESLSNIPGMVGMLPGNPPAGQSAGPNDTPKFGFIGLSESVAEASALYTFDRKRAATTRFTAV